MLRSIVSLCVRRHGIVAVLTGMALFLGFWGARGAPLDVFPEFVPSQVDIQTEAPGFAPEQVEQLVTRPVESAVNGASGIATLRSESIPGLSVVTITFADGADVHVARQEIAERISELGSGLPAGVGTPKLSPLVSSTMDLLKIGLLSDRMDAYQLRDIANWVLKPQLLAVPGVAHVIVFGGSVRQIQIQPDTDKLSSYGVTFSDVADAARGALQLRGAGFVDTDAQRVLLRSPVPQPDTRVVSQAVIGVRNNTPVLISDVARVAMAPAVRSGDSLIMGRPGVLLSLSSQYGANTLNTTLSVEKRLAEIAPGLQKQGVRMYTGLHRPATFIERALRNLGNSLVIAALLILAVLYIFLRNVRAALIAFTAIPLSLLAAVAVLRWMGMTLNTMTLGGFAVALGVLVDDAIIGIENLMRRLSENAALKDPVPRLDVVREASLEVRGPVIYATIVVIAVFMPPLFTSSVQGRFVGPLALSFMFAVLASLVVALTSTPALCALLLRDSKSPSEPAWLARLKSVQRSAIEGVSRHVRVVSAVLMCLALAAIVSIPFAGGTFMPDFREGHFVMQVSSAIPGTSLEEMLRIGQRISRDVLALPFVQTVEQQVGRAEMGEDTWGPHRSELHVELKPEADIDQGEAQARLRAILRQYPGIQSEVVTFLGDRISESLSGETAQVAVKVFGNDLDALDRTAGRMISQLRGIPGIADLQFKQESGTPTLSIHPLPQLLAVTGLRAVDVLDTVEAAYAGASVGQTFEGIRTVDAVVLLNGESRRRPLQVANLMINSPIGPVPLSQVARVEVTTGRYSIRHESGQRLVTVTFNVSGRPLQAVVNEARTILARSAAIPAGVSMEFTGAAEAELRTRNELIFYSVLAIGSIVLVLFAAFRWRSNSVLVLANLPFSLIGSVLAIWVTGVGLSLGTVVGLVTVFGISARNAILQLSHYEHLVEVEGVAWSRAAVLQGANERLVPILMTAAVTALGLVPLAAGLSRPGQEIEGPMAVTVLGGLLSSTALNLFVLPALVVAVHRMPRRN